jgi:hypothetical protein
MNLSTKMIIFALTVCGCLLSGCSSLDIEGATWSIETPQGPAQSAQLCVDQEGTLYAQTNANGKVAIEKLTSAGESKWKTPLFDDDFVLSGIDGCSLQHVLVASRKSQQYNCSYDKSPEESFRLFSLTKKGTFEWKIEHLAGDKFAIYDLAEDALGNSYVLLAQWPCIDGKEHKYPNTTLISFDSKGQFRYRQTYSLDGGFPTSLAIDGLNNIYIGGRYWLGHFLIALNKHGEPRWHLLDSNPAAGSIEGMTSTEDGGLYTCGDTQKDIIIQKYDTYGHKTWIYQEPQRFTPTLSNQCITANAESVYAMSEQYYKNELTIIKLDGNGKLIKKTTYKIPQAFIADIDSKKGGDGGVSIGGSIIGSKKSFYIRVN